MNSQAVRTIEHIKEKIALLEKVARAIESLPDLGVSTLCESCESICMSVPYDPQRIRQVRVALGKNWIADGDPHVMPSTGDWIAEYYNANDPDVKLTLLGSILETGATCKRVKAGTRIETIYKIVCGDELTPAEQLSEMRDEVRTHGDC